MHAARNVSRVTKFKVTRDFWDFSKGLLDKGETGLDAALPFFLKASSMRA